MINKLCSLFYDIVYRLDKKNIEEYSYETAPYCGHHYSGHSGKYTESRYHEGMGAKSARLGILWVSRNTEETDWDYRFIVLKNPICVYKKLISKNAYEVIRLHGFIGYRRFGFKNKWFTSFKPFAPPITGAWHFLGFRFTKSIIIK